MTDLNIAQKVSQIFNSIRQIFAPELPPETIVNRNPIFIFQMGRVGSKSMELSLLNAYRCLSLDIPVFHSHFMNNYEEIESRARRDMPDPEPFIQFL